jgi:hypothetical protein
MINTTTRNLAREWRRKPAPRRWLHTIAHRWGRFTGYVICWHDADGVLWSGFQCDTCGKIEHIAECPSEFQSF